MFVYTLTVFPPDWPTIFQHLLIKHGKISTLMGQEVDFILSGLGEVAVGQTHDIVIIMVIGNRVGMTGTEYMKYQHCRINRQGKAAEP